MNKHKPKIHFLFHWNCIESSMTSMSSRVSFYSSLSCLFATFLILHLSISIDPSPPPSLHWHLSQNKSLYFHYVYSFTIYMSIISSITYWHVLHYISSKIQLLALPLPLLFQDNSYHILLDLGLSSLSLSYITFSNENNCFLFPPLSLCIDIYPQTDH